MLSVEQETNNRSSRRESGDLLASAPVKNYLDATVRSWLGVGEKVAGVPQLPDQLARRLLRLEEYETPHRDQWGLWEHSFCESYQSGRLWDPEIDVWIAETRNELMRRGVKLRSVWPNGKAFALCISHDVDMVCQKATSSQLWRALLTRIRRDPTLRRKPLQMARGLASYIKNVSRTSTAPSVARSVEFAAEIARKHGAVSSFFVPVFPVPGKTSRYDCVYRLTDRCDFRGKRTSVAEMFRALADEGFDIGLHGSYYSAFEPGILEQQKRILEKHVGRPVVSTRQHFLGFDMAETPRFQALSGMKVDSTLGFNRNIGYRAGVSLPYFLFDVNERRPHSVLELPLILQDGAIFGSNALEADRALAIKLMKTFIDRTAEAGGCLTVLFHPDQLENPAPRELFEFALSYSAGKGAWMTSAERISSWWSSRDSELLNDEN